MPNLPDHMAAIRRKASKCGRPAYGPISVVLFRCSDRSLSPHTDFQASETDTSNDLLLADFFQTPDKLLDLRWEPRIGADVAAAHSLAGDCVKARPARSGALVSTDAMIAFD